jgi:hypothetical protein
MTDVRFIWYRVVLGRPYLFLMSVVFNLLQGGGGGYFLPTMYIGMIKVLGVCNRNAHATAKLRVKKFLNVICVISDLETVHLNLHCGLTRHLTTYLWQEEEQILENKPIFRTRTWHRDTVFLISGKIQLQ